MGDTPLCSLPSSSISLCFLSPIKPNPDASCLQMDPAKLQREEPTGLQYPLFQLVSRTEHLFAKMPAIRDTAGDAFTPIPVHMPKLQDA